jgi:hypothetical protein
MATETEVVKACFGSDLNGRAAATMAIDARPLTAPIEVVVMTQNAVYRAVFVVRKVYDQPLTATQERFAQSQGCRSAHQWKQRD